MNNASCNCDNCVAVEKERGVVLWQIFTGDVSACRKWEKLLSERPCCGK